MPARRRPACALVFALVAAFACENQSGGGSGTESSGGGGTGSSGGGTGSNSGSSSMSDSQGMNGPVGGGSPRWVLRDKDGAVVPAIVEPYCLEQEPEGCRVPDIGALPTFPCVHVSMFEDRYVGLVYGVADGSPLTCHPAEDFPSPFTSCSAEPSCGGPRFSTGAEGFGSDRPDAVRTVFRKGDELFYISSSQPVEQDCFFLDPVEGCRKYGVPLQVFPIVPVPTEYVELLAAGAPYTLAAAYD